MRSKKIQAVFLCLVLAGCLVGAAAAAEPAPLKPKFLASFDIPKDGRMIVLPVSMGGKTYQFMLDTGSSFSTFDEILRPLLGKPRLSNERMGSDGKMHVEHVYYAPDAKLGDLSFRSGGAVLCVDLDELRQLIGLDIRGVIGMGFLRQYVMQIDCSAGVISFFKAGDEAAAPADWGQPSQMQRAPQGSPLILGRLYDKYEGPFVIDTGYGDTGTLSAKLFDRLRKEELFKGVSEMPIETTEGSAVGISARVDGFSIGKLEYKNMIFDKAPGSSMLGMGFVRRQKLTLDFPNLKAYLQKGPAFDSADQNDMSGLHLLKQNDGIVVYFVDKDYPGEAAGLKKDDLLYQINGKNVSNMSLWEVRKILSSKGGEKIDIMFQRDKKFFKTSLTLKSQL